MTINLDNHIIAKKIISNKIKIHVTKKSTSTNEEIKQLPLTANISDVLLAEYQSQGKGRPTKSWHSPAHSNILLSQRHQITRDMSGLSLVIGLAVRATIEQALTDHKHIKNCIKVKWPNDIMANSQKIAGILIEAEQKNKNQYAIIGIGLNVNMTTATTADINQPWTSMSLLSHTKHNRNLLAARLINNLNTYINNFNNNGLTYFSNEWLQHDYLIGSNITLTNGSKATTGTSNGINDRGHLVITSSDDKQHVFATGSISKEHRANDILNTTNKP